MDTPGSSKGPEGRSGGGPERKCQSLQVIVWKQAPLLNSGSLGGTHKGGPEDDLLR